MNSPMWLTSNSPAFSRTALCSAVIPVGYWTGISNPANGTIFAPKATWVSWSGVRLRGAASFVPPAPGAGSGGVWAVAEVVLDEGLAGALAAWEGAFRDSRASEVGVGSIMSGRAKERAIAQYARSAPRIRGAP